MRSRRRCIFTKIREWCRSATATDYDLADACEPRGMRSAVCFTAQLHVEAPNKDLDKLLLALRARRQGFRKPAL